MLAKERFSLHTIPQPGLNVDVVNSKSIGYIFNRAHSQEYGKVESFQRSRESNLDEAALPGQPSWASLHCKYKRRCLSHLYALLLECDGLMSYC